MVNGVAKRTLENWIASRNELVREATKLSPGGVHERIPTSVVHGSSADPFELWSIGTGMLLVRYWAEFDTDGNMRFSFRARADLAASLRMDHASEVIVHGAAAGGVN